jgi:hypothetical protein
MMVVALYLIALAMVVGGAAAAAQGYVYVMVEFGWSMLIAGSVVATGGAVLFGLAHVAARLKRLEATANRAADRAGRGGVIFPEQPDTLARLAGPAVPNMTATAGAGLTGLGVSAVAAAAAAGSSDAVSAPRPDREPEIDRETKLEPVAEAEPPLGVEPSGTSRFGDAPARELDLASAPEKRAEQSEPEAPEIASVPIVARDDLNETVEAEAPSEIAVTPKDRFSMDEAALVEIDDLPKTPAPEIRPFPPQTEAVDRLPPRPEPVEEEPAAPSTAEEEPPSRGFRLRDIFASRSSREERNPPPIPAPPPLPPFSMRVDPPLPVPPPPPEPEAPEPDIDRPDELDHAPERQLPEGDASEEPVVVGTYMSGGNQYVMYSDGSIEAETPTGRYRFKSLEELKGFIETGAETPVT